MSHLLSLAECHCSILLVILYLFFSSSSESHHLSSFSLFVMASFSPHSLDASKTSVPFLLIPNTLRGTHCDLFPPPHRTEQAAHSFHVSRRRHTWPFPPCLTAPSPALLSLPGSSNRDKYKERNSEITVAVAGSPCHSYCVSLRLTRRLFLRLEKMKPAKMLLLRIRK